MVKRVLLAEDDVVLRTLLADFFTEEGWSVTAVSDGLAALHIAVRETPALILLDGHMPRLDGFEFARLYFALPGPHSPIVLMTGDLTAAREAALAPDVRLLPKPFSLEELLALAGGTGLQQAAALRGRSPC